MEMRSGPKVSGRNRRVTADQGWPLRGVPLYMSWWALRSKQDAKQNVKCGGGGGGGGGGGFSVSE